MLSSRVPPGLKPNALARLRGERARIPYDLTVSNPTLCGIPYPEALLAPLARPEGLVYRPDPLGIAGAREAVAEECSRRGLAVDPGSLVLTASTSEAYSFLFKLLCDPGQAVLVPAPSYPLFEHLASLDCVRAVPYPLDPSGGWQPHLDALAAIEASAVILVHPNNPTGTYMDPRGAEEVVSFCARRGTALIVDEVFHDYVLAPASRAASFAGTAEVLTFTLSGLSKYLGLPQIKLAWTVVSGPARRVDEALDHLTFIADSYLSVSTPVQLSLRHLFLEGAPVREEIRARCLANLHTLAAAVAQTPGIALVRPQAGWSAVLRFPNVTGEEALALELLEEDGVAVHPGYFFDFHEDGYLSLSLLPQPEVFAPGIQRILDRIVSKVEP